MKTKAERRITAQDKRHIRKLFKEGIKRKDIANDLGLAYSQVQHVLEGMKYNTKYKKAYKKKPQREERYEVAQIKEVDDYESLKAKYRKALALLIENDLLDVELE
jgi:IS30 family transposase